MDTAGTVFPIARSGAEWQRIVAPDEPEVMQADGR